MALPNKLTAAAEELIKATYLEIQDEAYAMAQKQTANSIKEVETRLKSKIDLINENDNKKIDKLARNVQSLNNTSSSCDARSKYDWALDYADYGAFSYYVKNHNSQHRSSYLIRPDTRVEERTRQ